MLNQSIEGHALERPQSVAIVDHRGPVTYSQLVEKISDVANHLSNLGVRAGTVVATCLDSDGDLLVVLYALAKLGAIALTLDVTQTGSEIGEICADAEPKLILATAAVAAVCAVHSPEGSQTIVVNRIEDILANDKPEQFPFGEYSGNFLLQYTSGTSGKPKGVLITQRALVARTQAWIATSRLTPEDSHLCILPISHGYGCYCVCVPALMSGGTLHIMRLPRVSPQRVLKYVKKERLTCIYALPFFYSLMTESFHPGEFDLSSVRLAMVGSAPVTAEVQAKFLETFGIPLNNTYGLSEIGIITSDLADAAECDASIGSPLKGIQIQIAPHPLASGSDEGELWAKSDGLASCYYGLPGKLVTGDGWLRTGDLVRADPKGRLHILGRVSSFINVSGNKVTPREIEVSLKTLPGVLDVAVFGVRDSVTGEAVAAAIVSNDLKASDVIEHCRQHLSHFKLPKHIRFYSKLPKSPAGKVRIAELKQACQQSQ